MLKAVAEGVEQALPEPMRLGARRARQMVTGLNGRGTFFEELGFSYIGPIDGHDMAQLLAVLRAARTRATGPVLIHCCTVKGKGYAPAEGSADKYHGVSKFDVASGVQAKSKATRRPTPRLRRGADRGGGARSAHRRGDRRDARRAPASTSWPSGFPAGFSMWASPNSTA